MSDENKAKMKIFVVDDDPIFLKYLTHFFTRRDYEVESAPDGRGALEQARRFQPDAIILDWDMPEVDGISACKMLKADEATCQIPVVILTARESVELDQMAFGAGAQATVLKSMNRGRLLNIVEVAIQSKKVSESIRSG